jgi:hypothetical protein
MNNEWSLPNSSTTDLLTPGELAKRLKVKASWVYEHADQLGAYRLGKYLRFDMERVFERLKRGGLGPPNGKHPTDDPN